MKNRYRIVTDMYAGFEAQVKFWWWPFGWFQMHGRLPINTFTTVEKAEEFILAKTTRKVVKIVYT